jgi:hypothetical protein
MPCGNFLIMPHVTILKPSLVIIMDDGDQCFEKKTMSKNLHNATWQFSIDGWQSMTSCV